MRIYEHLYLDDLNIIIYKIRHNYYHKEKPKCEMRSSMKDFYN